MLLFADGFDSYAATADLTKKWASNSNATNVTWNSTGGRHGGGCLQLVTSGNIASGSLGPLTNDNAVSFYFKATAKPSSRSTVLFVYNASNDLGDVNTVELNVRVRVETTGTLSVINYNSTLFSTFEYATAKEVCDGQWHHIEFRIQTPASNVFTLYVDGIAEIDATSANSTGVATLDRIAFQAPASGTWSIDDVFVYNSTAGTLTGDPTPAANFPIGNTKITTIRPDGAGSLTQFTPSTGANYTTVDEVNPNTADYVDSTVIGQIDYYTFGALGFTPTVVRGVVLNAYASNPEAGANNLKGKALSAAATATGATVAAPAAYDTLQWMIPRDPNTSAAWAGAAIDAAEFGLEAA